MTVSVIMPMAGKIVALIMFKVVIWSFPGAVNVVVIVVVKRHHAYSTHRVRAAHQLTGLLGSMTLAVREEIDAPSNRLRP